MPMFVRQVPFYVVGFAGRASRLCLYKPVKPAVPLLAVVLKPDGKADITVR